MWNDWPSQSTGMDLKIFNKKIVKCILNWVFIFTFLKDIKWFKTYDATFHNYKYYLPLV